MTGSTIAIVLNGDAAEIPPDTTVAALIDRLGAGPKGIAVARNEAVVPRSAWPDTVLVSADRIEILDAAQGG